MERIRGGVHDVQPNTGLLADTFLGETGFDHHCRSAPGCFCLPQIPAGSVSGIPGSKLSISMWSAEGEGTRSTILLPIPDNLPGTEGDVTDHV